MQLGQFIKSNPKTILTLFGISITVYFMLTYKLDIRAITIITLLLGYITNVFVGLTTLVGLVPVIGPLIVKVFTIPFFWLLNGMGYFNPHATSNFIMGLMEYVRFFFKYMLRTQPFLIWSWFWGAMVTLFLTFSHFIRPPMKDPLKIEERTAEVAKASQVSPDVVRKLEAVSVASACSNPIRIIRELWLDRALLFLGMLYFGFQFMATINFRNYKFKAKT